MKKILTLIILLVISRVVAQSKQLFKIIETTQTELKFTNFSTSSDLFSFRLENLGQNIELRILSDSTKIGIITNYLTQSSRLWRKRDKFNEGKKIPKVYVQKQVLTELEFEKAFKLIEKHKITDLKSDSEIKEWEEVLDGEWFSISQKVNGIFKRKTYGNPKLQENIKEANTFLKFHSELDSQIKFTEKFDFYFSELKFGCYSDNSAEIKCKFRKKKWWQFWK